MVIHPASDCVYRQLDRAACRTPTPSPHRAIGDNDEPVDDKTAPKRTTSPPMSSINPVPDCSVARRMMTSINRRLYDIQRHRDIQQQQEQQQHRQLRRRRDEVDQTELRTSRRPARSQLTSKCRDWRRAMSMSQLSNCLSVGVTVAAAGRRRDVPGCRGNSGSTVLSHGKMTTRPAVLRI